MSEQGGRRGRGKRVRCFVLGFEKWQKNGLLELSCKVIHMY